MPRHACLLLAAVTLAACLSPTAATAQIYGAQLHGGDLYMFIDVNRLTVNQSNQIPPSYESLTIARDCGCDVLIARRDTGEENARIHRLNQWASTITVIDTLDAYDEPVALCRGPGADMYIMVDGWAVKAGAGPRDEEHPYIGRLQDGLPPVGVIRYFDGGFTDLVDMQVWRHGTHATNVATLERRNDGVDEWWDIGEYQMTVEDTLDRVGWRFDDSTVFPTTTDTMTSVAIMPSGDVLLASTDSLYLVDYAGETAPFGDGFGAADLEVGADGIVYALWGDKIRRYEDNGDRILPDLTAPNPMVDLAVGDFVFTPTGPNVLVEPAPDVEIMYEEGSEEGQTSAAVETTSSRLSPGGSLVPMYAVAPEGRSAFTYVTIGTDAIYNSLIQVDVLKEGSRLFYSGAAGDTFRDFTVVGSIEDARGTIPRFEELPCPGDTTGRPPVPGDSEVVLVEDTRPPHTVVVRKFDRLEVAMTVPDTLPPCPWGIIYELQDRATTARAHHDLGHYGSALSELVLMNYELRHHAGWCVPDSSNAPIGNRVGRILAHSKTLMFSIEREWETSGVDEDVGALALAVTTPARDECLMAIYGPAGVEVEVSVYDVAGRRVAVVHEGTLPQGGTAVVWDGRDSTGRRVGSGVYFARATIEGGSATAKLVYVR